MNLESNHVFGRERGSASSSTAFRVKFRVYV